MRLQQYDTDRRCQARVLRSERLTEAASRDEVRELSIEIQNPEFDAKVGQNIGVLAPGLEEMGQAHHFRLYSIADVPRRATNGNLILSICVRRCSYIDPFSGEAYPGVASNYLCDLRDGDAVTITGPYERAFELPGNYDPNLILIGAGTGIAPFRAFVKHIYNERPDFQGHVWMFHGSQTGLDRLYRNDQKNDFAMYYDRETFEAFDALAKRPGWSELSDWGAAMHARGGRLREMLMDSQTWVYVAGLEKVFVELDKVLSEVMHSQQEWLELKDKLIAEGRWNELLYS